MGALERPQRHDITFEEEHASVLRSQLSPDHVEQCGLAGAIRSHQYPPFAHCNLEGHIPQRMDAAKTDRKVAHAQRIHGSRPRRRLRAARTSPTTPAGARSTTIAYNAPKTRVHRAV